MRHASNEFGQPVGAPVPDWTGCPPPERAELAGAWARLEPLDPARHAEALHAAFMEDPGGSAWTYLPYGPFRGADEYRRWIEQTCRGADPLFFALIDRATDAPGGVAAYSRIDPRHGVIEVAHLAFAPRLQRTRAATDALYCMLRYAFDLGYRRCEWKCDALNAPSRAAAERLGFTYEGTFRQALVTKGCNRDTAWFSIIDTEWPARRAALERWLEPANFDPAGRQRVRLSTLTRSASHGGT